VYNYTPNTHTN